MSFERLTELDESVRILAGADAPPEVFKILQQASGLAAPRAALFLIRQGQLRGWASLGYGAEVARALQSYVSRVDAGWLAGIESRRADSGGAGSLVDFGQPPAVEATARLLRIKGTPIAMILLERAAGDPPWFPQAVDLLVRVAELRLELNLALKRMAAMSSMADAAAAMAGAEAGPPPVAGVPVEPAARDETGGPSATAAGTETPHAETSAVAPLATPPAAEQPELAAARRYARLVATDIRLYNEEAVTLGRRHGDLTERLGDHLGRGKETFLRRHGALGPTGLELLREAYVQVLAAGDGQLIPSSVLE